MRTEGGLFDPDQPFTNKTDRKFCSKTSGAASKLQTGIGGMADWSTLPFYGR